VNIDGVAQTEHIATGAATEYLQFYDAAGVTYANFG